MCRRHGRLGMAIVAVLLAASGCGIGDPGSRPDAGEGWRQLAASPLSPRIGHSAVWTGQELLIWGGGAPGGRPKADGAAYDPATDRWRRLPPAPLARRSWHAAVWTGTDMLAWGGVQPGRGGRSEVALADGAAYRPTTRTWRPIPPAPLAGDTAVWSGTELLVLGRAERGPGPWLGGAAWDPRGGRWRRLATSPLPAGNEFDVVLAGGAPWPPSPTSTGSGPATAACTTWPPAPGACFAPARCSRSCTRSRSGPVPGSCC